MSRHTTLAEQCLVATCAHLSLAFIRDENFPMWLEVLGEVLPDTLNCSDALIPLRVSAETVARAAAGMPRDNAMSRLRLETARYYRSAAGFRYEKWRDFGTSEVLDA